MTLVSFIDSIQTGNFDELSLFSDFNIWFRDFFTTMGNKRSKVKLNFDIPLPLIGFKTADVGETEVLAFKPNKSPSAYGGVKVLNVVQENTPLRVDVYNSLMEVNDSTSLVIGKNWALKELMEEFTKKGGVFLVLSPSGIFSNCILTSIKFYNKEPQFMGQRMMLEFENIVPINKQARKVGTKEVEIKNKGGII